jgi:hypothetical protein
LFVLGEPQHWSGRLRCQIAENTRRCRLADPIGPRLAWVISKRGLITASD